MQIKIIFIDSKAFWRISRAPLPLVIHVLLFIFVMCLCFIHSGMMYMRQREGILNNNKRNNEKNSSTPQTLIYFAASSPERNAVCMVIAGDLLLLN
jgi:hypothetical protein